MFSHWHTKNKFSLCRKLLILIERENFSCFKTFKMLKTYFLRKKLHSIDIFTFSKKIRKIPNLMKPKNYNSHKQKSGIEIGQIAKKYTMDMLEYLEKESEALLWICFSRSIWVWEWSWEWKTDIRVQITDLFLGFR